MTPPHAFPPRGYVRFRSGEQDAVAREPVVPAIVEALAVRHSLADWAAGRARAEVAGGRGPVWRVDLGGTPAAVRHYRRGGWMGPLLGDRYFGRSPRPFHELAVSEALREAGVPTPRVLAVVVAPARPGYRADIATEWLSPGLDLEELLRPNLYAPEDREPAVEAAGWTVGRAHAAGLDHPDLRPRNLFLQPQGAGAWEAALLDLDRARLVTAEARSRRAKKKTSTASTARSRRRVARAA